MKKQEEELKTLKDCKDLEEARAEAIKWIKEDVQNTPAINHDVWDLIFRWTDRLNITEEDLKEEKA